MVGGLQWAQHVMLAPSAFTPAHKEPCLSDANLHRSACHTCGGFQTDRGQSVFSSHLPPPHSPTGLTGTEGKKKKWSPGVKRMFRREGGMKGCGTGVPHGEPE